MATVTHHLRISFLPELPFDNLLLFTRPSQDPWLLLVDSGKCVAALPIVASASIRFLSPHTFPDRGRKPREATKIGNIRLFHNSIFLQLFPYFQRSSPGSSLLPIDLARGRAFT